jgi:surfactin synthase thioesterase subunit
MHETLYNNMDEMVDDVLGIIKDEIRHCPYTLFGHSMGSSISYRLAQKIRSIGLRQPLHIFFSGRGAPHIGRPDEKKYHLMDNDEFRDNVIELGGTPPEFFDHPELLELFMPRLRNDFKLAEEESHDTAINPLDVNITVFLGKEDDLTPDQCDGWKVHTRKLCSTHYFNGGHFFLLDHVPDIVRLIDNTLHQSLSITSAKLKLT